MKVATMQMTQKFELKTLQKLITEAIPLAFNAKIEVMEFERGYVKLKLPYEPNKNHLETMYAGALYTLGEIPGGAILIGAFDMSKFFPTLAKMHTKFIKPAVTDITCEVRMSEEEL